VPQGLALCYHALSPRWPAPLSVAPAALEHQLVTLAARGYRGVTFTELVTRRPQGKVVAVTFDDAFRSVYELAAPILARLSLPGTVFVPTAFAGDTPRQLAWPGIDQWAQTEFAPELTAMSWSELEELAAAGWEIGSHTSTHPRLTTLRREALHEELARPRSTLEDRLGKPCVSLAYPYGAHDERVIAAADQAGYLAAGTIPRRLGPAVALAWPRVGVYRVDDLRRFRLKVSPVVRRLRASRVWPEGATPP
jgi:peptidoglycan/xylan/chitin deacetylase (PgdA/CDA1 family)